MSARSLVTGGAGFIGHHLVRALAAAGHEVTVLDDLSVGRLENLAPGTRLVRGDVRDGGALADALDGLTGRGVTNVFHLAAVVSVRASVDDFVRDADVNFMGTLRLIEAMRGRGIERAVFASSMAVYSDGIGAAPLREDHPTHAAAPYGIAKLAAERAWHLLLPRLGVRAAVLRFFNTYGPGQTPSPYVGVITHFAERMLRGEPPVVFGDGEQRRDFVHVDDVVQATLATLSHDVDGLTLNVGSGVARTVNEVARALSDALGFDGAFESAPAQPGELRSAVADITLARDRLGYRPSRLVLDVGSVLEPLARARTR